MFHFKFHVSLFKTLRERVIAPSVFLYRSHSVFGDETLKRKVKHWNTMFHLLESLIINRLKHKNET